MQRQQQVHKRQLFDSQCYKSQNPNGVEVQHAVFTDGWMDRWMDVGSVG